MFVEMALRRIHHDIGDEDVFERCDRLAALMLVDGADLEILEVVARAGQFRIIAGHAVSPGFRRRMRLDRRNPTILLPSPSKPSVRQVTIPLRGSLDDRRFSVVSLLATTVVPG